MHHHRLLFPIIARPLYLSLSSVSRAKCSSRSVCVTRAMCNENLSSSLKGLVNFRLCNVSGIKTELLEIHTDDPVVHILLIPGNPGVVTYYKNFVESLYVLFGENVSVTAIGHTGHTEKDWEKGRLFSLQDQIEHKIDFIEQELKDVKVPILLIGHSIGSYICIEVFKRTSEKVIYCIGLYPFLTLNMQSRTQSIIRKIAASSLISVTLSYIVGSLGLLGNRATKFLVSKTIGKSWSDAAIVATCSHMLKYHAMRNVLFMAKTEFEKLKAAPDWAFMKEYQEKITFLFGMDDHWGPVTLFDQIAEQVPEITLSMESEGHTHAFCCTEAGSIWVARNIWLFMKKKIQNLQKQ